MAVQPILDMLAVLVQQARPLDIVYAYDVFAMEPADAEAAYGVADANFSKGWTIRAWMLARTDTPERWDTNAENVRVHTVRLQAYWEVPPAQTMRCSSAPRWRRWRRSGGRCRLPLRTSPLPACRQHYRRSCRCWS